MSLEIRPLAALYPPPRIQYLKSDTIERGANTVGMSIPPLATTESQFLFMGVWEYKAFRGLISWDIIKKRRIQRRRNKLRNLLTT